MPRPRAVKVFLSTPSARRATGFCIMAGKSAWIFLSTPSARRATFALVQRFVLCQFLSTPSARRATLAAVAGHGPLNISIHALREEGDVRFLVLIQDKLISIHALREEGDARSIGFISSGCGNFYPRPPRGGRHNTEAVKLLLKEFLSTPSARRATEVHEAMDKYIDEFLSTPSARRATAGGARDDCAGADFYPRPPRGGRQQKQRQNLYFQTNYTTFCTNLEEP